MVDVNTLGTADLSSTPSSSAATRRASAFVFAGLAAQFALVVAVASSCHVTSPAFERVLPGIAAACAVHYWLRPPFKLPFFTVLSIASIGFVLGLQPTGWNARVAIESAGALLLVGVCLISIAEARLSLRLRLALLITLGVVLAYARDNGLGGQELTGMWPVLGSMFMFRLIVYVHDRQHEPPKVPFWRSLAYFFMLPNVCFPLYPVVDWKSFGRDYFSDEPLRIYQTGLHWMARGLSQCVLYELILGYFYVAPDDVTNGEQLARHVFSNYGLYLRVSGQFHLIIGLLHLFGWNLGATNHHYYLADSFTDYWRRVNIYWKEFMLKVFYNPIAYRSRSAGAAHAVLLGSLGAFAATWFLHGYQAFWLTGNFRFSSQDGLFWGILGALVVVNAHREATRGRRRRLGQAFDSRRSFGAALRTMGVFAALTALWSLWSAPSPSRWLELWVHADATFWSWSAVVLLAVGACKVCMEAATAFRDGILLGTIPRGKSQTGILAIGFCTCALPLVLVWWGHARVVASVPRQAVVDVALDGNLSNGVPPARTGRGYYEDLLENASYPGQWLERQSEP